MDWKSSSSLSLFLLTGRSHHGSSQVHLCIADLLLSGSGLGCVWHTYFWWGCPFQQSQHALGVMEQESGELLPNIEPGVHLRPLTSRPCERHYLSDLSHSSQNCSYWYQTHRGTLVHILLLLLYLKLGDGVFPHDALIKTLPCNAGGCGFYLCSRNYDPTCLMAKQMNNNK